MDDFPECRSLLYREIFALSCTKTLGKTICSTVTIVVAATVVVVMVTAEVIVAVVPPKIVVTKMLHLLSKLSFVTSYC